MINVVEKTEGQKIPYELMGDLLMLDSQLYFNLPVYQRDHDVHLDVSRNEYGMLVNGLSRAYVAEIDIAARAYDEVDTGNTDEEGNPIIEKVARAFSLDQVTLTLWGVNE